MKILVGMAHPKHVYMFKNFIKEMENRGHEIRIVAIEKDITVYLLKQFNMPYTLIGKNPSSICRKVLNVPKWEYQTLKISRKFRPDIYVGQALPHFAHVSTILKKPYIIFEDTESATAVQKVCFSFADAIVTPNCYKVDLGKKQVRFDGYYELAYLHPNYFTPNPLVLENLDLDKNDKFIVMRLVSWRAMHDIGQRGFDLKMKKRMIKSIEKYGKVFITSENPLPKELEKYRISEVAKENIHDLLYYATMYIGESPTMATESAVLGTPAFCMSSWACSCGNFEDLSKKYELIYCSADQNHVVDAALELLKCADLKNKWHEKRKKLLLNKIDVTKFMVGLVEKYNIKRKEMIKHE